MSEQQNRPVLPEEACETMVDVLLDAGFQHVSILREPDDDVSVPPVGPGEETT